MIREELEFRIARYADGDLTEAERLAVEAELADDAEARALLAEYRTLRSAIEDAAGSALPKVHWDRLEQLLSAAISRSASPANDHNGGAKPESGDGPFVASLDIEQEWAIACHADGSLSPERRAQVEQLLVSDRGARAVFDEYHDLDAAIKSLTYSDSPPVIQWDRLAKRISKVVDAGANAGLPEDIERQIAMFVDGSLPADEFDAVEVRLAADPMSRVVASDYRDLDAALNAIPLADPAPPVDWDRFAHRISAAIDRQAVQAAVRSHKAREDSYSILNRMRSPSRMALAASVLIGMALIGRMIHLGPGQLPPPARNPIPSSPVENIAVLTPEGATGSSVSDVNIGPPAIAQAQLEDDVADDDGVIARPPRAFVASGRTTPSEAAALPATPF